MDSQTAYEVWAPSQSMWSAWAKPVLFAHLPSLESDLAYALRTWQKAGIELQAIALLDAARLQPLMLPHMDWLTGV